MDIVWRSLRFHCRVFLYANFGPTIGPFPFETLAKTMMNNISNLHFGENNVKIEPKIGKFQMFKLIS